MSTKRITKKVVLQTTSFTIQPSTQSKFIPRFFGDNIIVFVRSFLGKQVLPVVNNESLATTALIDAVIKCWFISNSTLEDVPDRDTKVRLLNFSNEAKDTYSLFGLTFLETARPRFTDVKKAFKKQIKRALPIFTNAAQRNKIFSDLLNLTNLILRRCGDETKGFIATKLDMDAINKLLTQFKERIKLTSPFD